MGYRHAELAAVLTRLPPGALSATAGPSDEKPTFVPAWRSPATAITPLQLAGLATAWPEELPADATITVPAAVASSTASWYAAEHTPSPPRLRLITRAGYGLA